MLVGAGAGAAWYNIRMRKLATGDTDVTDISSVRAVVEMYVWIETRWTMKVVAIIFMVVGLVIAFSRY